MTMTVGTPDDLKKPRKTRNEEPLSREEWCAIYEERLARYLPVDITGKIDVLVHDIKEIMNEAEERGSERPVKLIIYSNFAEAFTRIKLMLDTEGLRYTYAPPSCHLVSRVMHLWFHQGSLLLSMAEPRSLAGRVCWREEQYMCGLSAGRCRVA
jgi:hypothetical protein